MPVIDVLYEEHYVTQRALKVIKAAAFQLLRGNNEAIDPMFKAADFLLRFSVGCHQGKEEEILFPMLHHRGLPADIIEAMHVDHRAGEDYLRDLIGALIRYEGDENRLLSTVKGKASGHLMFLHHHLEIEENILFSMAGTLFAKKEQEILVELFALWETEREDENLHTECSSIIEGWERELRL
jgi:hemerythrin-like domain-containing protein